MKQNQKQQQQQKTKKAEKEASLTEVFARFMLKSQFALSLRIKLIKSAKYQCRKITSLETFQKNSSHLKNLVNPGMLLRDTLLAQINHITKTKIALHLPALASEKACFQRQETSFSKFSFIWKEVTVPS